MSKRKVDPSDQQVPTIRPESPFVQQSLDLKKQDKLVTSYAIDFVHYRAMPSPIGKKDRGDYRREDGVDTITSNGMIYRCAGIFSASMSDNSRSQKHNTGGIVDPSRSRLILPRFYNNKGLSDGKRIYLAPGDRLYVADQNADTSVSNYQTMDYEPDQDNVPMFPILQIEENIVDSRGAEYKVGIDFVITEKGNVRWLVGGKNPGIDPDTKKGRVYSVRYLYKGFWYVVSLPKEIRITNVTTNGVRTPERMPYFAEIVREYVYHNQNRGDKLNQNVSKEPDRATKEPVKTITEANPAIPVDMSAIGDDDTQS